MSCVFPTNVMYLHGGWLVPAAVGIRFTAPSEPVNRGAVQRFTVSTLVSVCFLVLFDVLAV